MALGEIEQRREFTAEATPRFMKAEQLMRGLLMEMRTDLAERPLSREFVMLKRAWSYWAKGNELAYFFDDHPDLENKVRILENLGLVQDITYNNVKRFVFTEELVDYLTAPILARVATANGLLEQICSPTSVLNNCALEAAISRVAVFLG